MRSSADTLSMRIAAPSRDTSTSPETMPDCSRSDFGITKRPAVSMVVRIPLGYHGSSRSGRALQRRRYLNWRRWRFAPYGNSRRYQLATSCGGTGDFLFMEDAGPLCVGCADLGHLVFLTAGDAALTRRAKRASGLSAVVVVRWGRSRKRYERPGRSDRKSSRSPSQPTPSRPSRNSRLSEGPTKRRRARSTAAFFVARPNLRITSAVSSSSRSMFVRAIHHRYISGTSSSAAVTAPLGRQRAARADSAKPSRPASTPVTDIRVAHP